MADPRWSGPPEAVASTFETGPGPASVTANNLVWVTETAGHEMSMGLSVVNTAATATQWGGLGAIASTVVAIGLNAGLQTLVGWTAEKVTVTQAAADAFTTAASSVIPSVVSQTNRDEWTALNATNFFGQNTPAIVERDIEYFGEHWPHNASIGWAYSGALGALSAALAVPPPIAPMGASPAAPAAASAAVAQAAAQTGMSDAMQASSEAAGQTASAPADMAGQVGSVAQPLQQAVSSAVEPLSGIAQAPIQAVQSVSSLPQTAMGSMGGMFPTAAAQDAAAAEAVAEPLGSGTATGVGAGFAGGGAGGVGVGTAPGAALTSYTRPNSSFDPETGGRPTGLRAGLLNATEVRGPTTSAVTGGTPMPMSAAGMLGRASAAERYPENDVTHARVVVGGEPTGRR